MLLDGLKHFMHRLGVLQRSKAIGRVTPQTCALDAQFDTTWHGDHWQNLLACPLDARHYVMEDWFQPAVTSIPDTAETKPTRRRRRGYGW